MMDRGAHHDGRARSSQDNRSDAMAVSPVSSESPSTTSHVKTIPKVGLSINAAPGHGPTPPSPGVSAMTVSEYDIKLNPLPLPPAGAWSTDKLIPTHAEYQLDKTNTVQLTPSWARPITTPLRPNYKPIPLRWAYQVLLLILIAGFFVFLEYETRLLPEPKFHAFKPAPVRISDSVESGHSQPVQPRSWPKRIWAAETQSLVGSANPTRTTKSEMPGPITATPARAVYARDPIPPESDFPKPSGDNNYCFWYPPRWRFQNLLSYFPMGEYIQFFEVSEDNKDVPLCPCHNVIYTEDGVTRVRVGSADEYCDAVINAIKTLNAMGDRQFSYWQGGDPYTTSFPWWKGPDRYWKTPPQLTRPPPWIYPSFDENGDVFLPLEKRTTAPGPNGEAVSDVFGRKLDAPYVGYFPAGHTGVETMWTYWGFQMRATDTLTHPETRSVLWWKFPLTRPDSALFIGDPSTSSMRSPTSVDPGIITTDVLTSSAASSPSSLSRSELSTTPVVESESSISPSSASPSTESPPIKPVTSSSSISPSGASPSTASPSSTPVTSPSSKSLESLISPITSSEQSQATQDPSVSDTQPASTILVALPTETSTTWTRIKSGDILWWATLTITSSSLTTTGSSTITDVQTITANGTTGLTTITRAIIPLVSTKTVVRTSKAKTTMRWLDLMSQDTWIGFAANTPPPGPVHLDTMLDAIPTAISTMTYFDQSGNPVDTYTGLFKTWTATVTHVLSKETVTRTLPELEIMNRPRPTGDSLDPDKWRPLNEGPYQPGRNQFFTLDSEKDFLMASLIPVLLATFLAIPIQIFVKTFNHMVPFRALRYRKRWGKKGGRRLEGAEFIDSVCLARGGISVFTAPKIGIRFIRKYQDPLPLLSFLLDIFTTVLIPLSSETIQIEFGPNRCISLDWDVGQFGYQGPCAIGLRKSVIPSRAAEIFMSVMSFIILVMGYLLWRWRTGVSADPWSVASMTALLSGSSREVKKLMLSITPPGVQQRSSSAPSGGARDSNDAEVEAATSKDIAKALEGKRFRLGYFQVSSGYDRYGSAQWRHDGKDGRWGDSIRSDTTWGQTGPYQHMSYGLELVSPDEAETGSVRLTVKEPPTRSSTKDKTTQQGSLLGRLVGKFKKLSLGLRISKKKENTSTVSRKRRQTTSVIPTVFLVLITGLLILILYYENTILDTPFERFMDSQTYGVRFMFTAMGTGITAFWDWYFAYICEKQHFSRLHAVSKPGHENSSESQQHPTARAAPASAPSCTCVRVNTTTSTILNAIPSNELAALYHAFFSSRLKFQARCQCAASNKYNTKRIDLTLAPVSLAAFLAKFAPILLSGVPFRNTITWKMHETYTWSLVAVLGYMVLVLGILLFPSQMLRSIGSRGRKENGKKTPPPPAPTSIAGYMYYVCDSVMLRDFEGLSTSLRKVREKAVMDMAARHHEGHLESLGGQGYAFGTMTGVSGVRRVGIDYADAR